MKAIIVMDSNIIRMHVRVNFENELMSVFFYDEQTPHFLYSKIKLVTLVLRLIYKEQL